MDAWETVETVGVQGEGVCTGINPGVNETRRNRPVGAWIGAETTGMNPGAK